MFRTPLHLILLVLVFAFSVEMAGAAGLKPDVLWWAFDEGAGTVATDSSGNGREGVITGAEWDVPGALDKGRALYFDGTGDLVEDDDAEDYLNGLDGLTMAMWIKADAIPTDKGFVIAAPPAGADSFCTMRYDVSGASHGGSSVLKMAVTSTGGEQQLESSASLQTTEWQHVAMTWSDGEPLRFYVDGAEDTPTGNSNGMAGTVSGCTTLIVGQGGKDSGGGWAGLIDDVQIYSRALTPEEIQMVAAGLGAAELAVDPVPADAATDIPRDVSLAWTAGEFAVTHDVYLGTVFEDVNDASRDNPMDVLLSQGQTATTYVPDSVFQYGQTYYWRVDEVNGAPDNTIFTGEVWSFTVEPVAYPIEGVTVTATSTSDPGVGPERTIDGSGLNEADEHSTANADMWLGLPAGADPVALEYDLGQVYKLHQMLVWNYNVQFEPVLGFGLKNVTVEYSTDGAEWTALGDVELAQAIAQPGYAANTAVDFGGVAARLVKITVNSNFGGLPQYGLSEVRFLQIPATAREPQPAAGATDVSVASTLSWRSGREAESHDVSLGTDADALELAGNVDVTSYDPGGLDLGATYFWKVDEVNQTEAISLWEGPVWSFATQAYLVVEDFEVYDDEDNRIYQTWVDGYGVPSNGSQVGNLESPFAEQTIVNGGAQSMPLFYDNAETSMSEAELTLAQNWTTNGIKSLSLYFRGAPDNTGQLYVKINGTKIAYDGAATDIAAAAWQSWNIDLSTAGNVSSVTSLIIGIEDAGASGVLYVDDVRLYPLAPELILPAEPDSAALVAHYEFEGNANDSSGNGLNGAVTNGQFVNSGKPGAGMAIQLTIPGYVDLGNPAILDFGTGDWTLVGWFKTAMIGTGDANKGTIVGKGGDTGGGHRYALILSESSEGVVTMITDDDSTKHVVNSTSVVNDDEWHVAVGQREGTALRIFIDGNLEGTGTAAADYDLSGTSQHNAYVGAITNHGNSDLYKLFGGLIDDVRIYNDALSAGEILWLSGRAAPKHKPF